MEARSVSWTKKVFCRQCNGNDWRVHWGEWTCHVCKSVMKATDIKAADL